MDKLRQPHLVWIFSGRLDQVLDAATWLETTRHLRRLGWRVRLVAVGPAGTRLLQGVEVICIPTIDRYFLRHFVFHLRLIGFLLRDWPAIDFILFNQGTAPWILPARLYNRLRRSARPYLVMDTRTVLMEDLSKGNWRDLLRGWFYQLTSRMANAWADGQTAITARMAAATGVPPQRLWGVWPTAASVELFTSFRSARRWPAQDQPLQIIYIGVVNHERNLLALCRAVASANRAGMQFRLTITGDGTAFEEIARFSLAAPEIAIHKPVPYAEIPALLAAAHLGAIPFPDQPKFQIGSPLKLFEYMASGLPILVTRIACHTDVLGDDPAVFWAEGSQEAHLLAALRAVWARRAELESISRRMAQLSEEHTWQISAERLSQALLSHLPNAAALVRLQPEP
jgi:glycosyltransferase involved in cell wall biosynthesis